MPRSASFFTMRFEVTNPLMTEGQKAETTIRCKAAGVDAALAVARAKLSAKGFTVGRCTDCRVKLSAGALAGR